MKTITTSILIMCGLTLIGCQENEVVSPETTGFWLYVNCSSTTYWGYCGMPDSTEYYLPGAAQGIEVGPKSINLDPNNSFNVPSYCAQIWVRDQGHQVEARINEGLSERIHYGDWPTVPICGERR